MKNSIVIENIGGIPKWQRFSAESVVPSKSSVLRLMGVPADKRDTIESVVEPFAKAVEIFKEKACPQGGYCICSPRRASEVLFAQGQHSKLYEKLRNAKECALFLVTVGEGPEEEAVRLLSEGEYLLGTILDTLASEAAECVVDKVQSLVVNELGLDRAVRFSPGYGGWSLEAQPSLLSSLKAMEHDISLTEALMMVPKKSVSGVIVPKVDSMTASPCSHCELTSCPKEGCWETKTED